MIRLILISLALCCTNLNIVLTLPTLTPDSDPINIHKPTSPNLYLHCASEGKKICNINVNGVDEISIWNFYSKDGVDRYEVSCDLEFEGQEKITFVDNDATTLIQDPPSKYVPATDIPGGNHTLRITTHCKSDGPIDVPEGTEGNLTDRLDVYYKGGETKHYSAINPIKAVKK